MSTENVVELQQQTLFEDEIVAATYLKPEGLVKAFRSHRVEPSHRNAHRSGTWAGRVKEVWMKEEDGQLVRREVVEILEVTVDE